MLLEISNLNLYLQKKNETRTLLHQINFQIQEKEIVALIGASGSGKTLFAHLLADLLPQNMKIEGEIQFESEKILLASKNKRNQKIAMIFQNPATCLNPTMKIKYQMREALSFEKKSTKVEQQDFIKSILLSLDLDPSFVLNSYPHQLSGGMQQRISIAIALAKNPKLLIADEPTTALDQALQKETLSLLKKIVKKNKIACLFITHNLSLLPDFCQKVSVMFNGKLVEQNTLEQTFTNPKHAYTKALVAATREYEAKWIP